MKTTPRNYLTIAGILVSALIQHQAALAATFTFQENDSPVNTSTALGTSSTFVEGAYSITANGYLVAGGSSALFAKYTSGNSGETGLGMVNDSFGNNEIDPQHFIQLNLSSLKSFSTIDVWLGSIQSTESGKVFWSKNAGTFNVANQIMPTLTANGFLDVTSYVQAGDYIDITAGSHNVLLTSVTACVPDNSSTLMLLGAALSAVGLLRKKLAA